METTDIILKAPAPGATDVYLFKDIDSASALETVRDLRRIHLELGAIERANAFRMAEHCGRPADSPVRRLPAYSISVILNTPGGFCYDGFCISNTISEICAERPVTVHASGVVASMGISVLLAVPLEARSASRNTTFMIHQVLSAMFGKVADLENRLDESKRIQAIIWDTIAKNTRITREQLQDCYDHKRDWYISAEEALELGLISKIV